MENKIPGGRAIQSRTLMLAQTAVLGGIMLVLNFSGLGLIKVGVWSLTILNVPVIIGAMTVGKWATTALGGLFGILILADAQVFLAISFPLTIFFLVGLRGLLYGFLCALIFEGFKKIDKTKIWSYGATGLCSAILNTTLFIVGVIVIFGSSPAILEMFGQVNRFGLFIPLILMVGVQAIIEIVVCAAIAMAVAKPVSAYLNKRA
ncbi:MAG: ECF transporter S component [Oscillospiraceae bacterium]|nr:ECF transporter S component [Oscillospiraceae bacterium]